METKDYSERVREIKNEVLDEIRDILGTDARHKFANPFHIHYVEGEASTTELCLAVEVWSDGMVVFCTGLDKDTTKAAEGVTEGDAVFYYEPNSFFDILDNLKKEIREEKLRTLRELVKKAGNEIRFDGNFEFFGTRETMVQRTKLMGIDVDDKGEFLFDCIASADGECWRDDSYPDADQLDGIIGYVNKEILHGSSEYKELMELLSLEENLYFNFVENGIAGSASIDVDVKGKYCQLDVQDVSRDDSGKLTIYGTIWDEDTQISDYSMEEKDIKPEYLIKIIEAIKSRKPSPEERLALTDEQKELAGQFKDVVRRMKEANIRIILEENTKDFYAVNYNEVEDFESSYYIDDNKRKDAYVEIPAKCNLLCKDVIGYYLYEDESLYAKFK